MTIVDMHAHIADRELFPDSFVSGMKETLKRRAAEEMGVELQPDLLDRIAARRLSDPDCRQLVAEMDAAGIQQTVLLMADFGYGPEASGPALDTLYARHHRVLTAYPDRFVVFGGADPRRGPEAVALFEHGLRDLGFSGLKLYPRCGYELDDAALTPYYELCEHYAAPVLAHTGPSLQTMYGDRRYPASIRNAAARFPRVSFVLGHAAFQHVDVHLGVAVEHRNVSLETSGFQLLAERREQLQHDLRLLFDRVPDQVVFGTDWPVFNINGTQRDWVAFFDDLGVLDDDEKGRFFAGNAQAILGGARRARLAAAGEGSDLST